MSVIITSFGYLHGPAPEAHITLDLRQHFRDPHINLRLRDLTAADREVQTAVLTTPGIYGLIDHVALSVRYFLLGPGGGEVRVAVGCAGGRHRAPTVATQLASFTAGEVVHRDLHRPVVDR